MNSKNISYSEKLDHLRFLAAFAVLMFHTEIQLPPVKTWFPLFHQGHAGVQLFMVISGLILAMIAYEKKLDIIKFYLNRILRIYPLFIVIISFGYFTNPNRPSNDGLTYLLSLLPISNLYRLNYGPFGGQLWSVAVELQFYIIFPFLILAINKYGERFLWYLLGFLILLRTLVYLYFGTVHMMAFFTIFGALDAFIVGVLAGRFHIKRKFSLTIWWAAAAFLLVNGVLYYSFDCSFFHWDYCANSGESQSKRWIVWPTIEAFLFAFLVITYLKSRARMPLSTYIASLGKWSYSIYVWHTMLLVLIIRYIADLGLHSYMVGAAIALPAIVAVSFSSYHLIEKPFLDLRVKYTY
jgi:peptidoglycan/LPS O-acetylase OafA/YrhL